MAKITTTETFGRCWECMGSRINPMRPQECEHCHGTGQIVVSRTVTREEEEDKR